MNPKVDFFFKKASQWQAEYAQLREIVLDCGLTEELKWGCPCYTFEGKNTVLIHGFKEYCALLFMKGALLGNADGLLIQQTENVQAARQMRFTTGHEIKTRKARIRAAIFEAIEVEKAGLAVTLIKSTELEYPEEFQMKLTGNPELKAAFEALTPGRQRAYNLYFSAPKQSKTREARVEKSIAQILEGKGLNEG